MTGWAAYGVNATDDADRLWVWLGTRATWPQIRHTFRAHTAAARRRLRGDLARLVKRGRVVATAGTYRATRGGTDGP